MLSCMWLIDLLYNSCCELEMVLLLPSLLLFLGGGSDKPPQFFILKSTANKFKKFFPVKLIPKFFHPSLPFFSGRRTVLVPSILTDFYMTEHDG